MRDIREGGWRVHFRIFSRGYEKKWEYKGAIIINSKMNSQGLQEINEYVKEYLRHHNMFTTLEAFEKEVKTKQIPQRMRAMANDNLPKDEPKMHKLFSSTEKKSVKELNCEQDFKEINKKYTLVIQAARQIFSVSMNLIQTLLGVRAIMENESLMELLENYKIQLGKYHKIVINDGKPEGRELTTEPVMQDHKNKLLTNYKNNNTDGLVEVLLSLRVNALQIAPELRKNLVYELIRNDIFDIVNENSFDLIVNILDKDSHSLKHAITSLISVISSTLKGVEYLTTGKNMIIIHKIIKILKDQEDGSVTQRFCIAILQKCSILDTVIPTYVENDMIYWVINLIKKSLTSKIHVFCLDFASAMLANVIHTPETINFLENQPDIAQDVMESLLRLIKEPKIQVSVLMHILIALSYLAKDNFTQQMNECRFAERIQQFVEYYSQIRTTDNEALEIDKKTVLDLCAHMFHPKDTTLDNSDSIDFNELSSRDRIREYENEQGELIFECFQDEVNQ